jgi:hypothetical protein
MSTVITNPHDDDAMRVERYADILRCNLSSDHDVYPALIGMIDSITDPSSYNPNGGGDRVDRVRDALAAAELVRAEILAAAR